ncbi:uncharacterized protein LOC115632630 [Scaptodrosophila lebanonensis]|uniref:Uncharacterized protein LOC115632630 n=1 Tax=Drosophila lebanonensis TaxID=7225 RepID=A0A6J2UCC8_DROLE|nr:uncharacterized protein LOC115632630 [Scaptodrosophila lebanonensis]
MFSYHIKRALRSIKLDYMRTMATQGFGTSISNDKSTDEPKILQFPEYTNEERSQILKIVNENDADQLLGYDITKARANKLETWKARNGPLRELSDIFYVEGFGLKVANKFYKSLLQLPVKRVIVPRARTAPFITPSLDEAGRQQLSSSTAVRIGVSSISWSRLELASDKRSPCTLTHWQHHELNDKKLHLAELAQRCLYVAHQIHVADCYILENPQMAQASSNPGSIDQQNVNIQKAQVTAMLSYALMARAFSNKPQTNLFYMRRFLTARLFNHLVGTERVSSEDTIIAMMRTFYNLHDQSDELEHPNKLATQNLRAQVQFPEHLRNMFAKQERHHRELLGQSFLLNLAFVRLVLLQDEASLAVVTRSSKQLPNDLPNL